MNGSSLFQATLICSSTMEIAGKLVDQFQAQIEKLDEDTSPDVNKKLRQKISLYTHFRCIQAFIYNFKQCQQFVNVKMGGEERFVDQSRLVTERLQLKYELCKFDISCISNTNEVANLYRTLRRRAERDSAKAASYAFVKDWLPAVLTIYADRRNAPLTITETAKRPQNFPCSFRAGLNLGCFYMA